MATGALFGNATGRYKSKNLVEFKAGKMQLKGKMCHPDKRKGLLYVYQADDSLMHFCWKDRTSGSVDDDLIIFPDDIEFKKVPQCTTGRVYVLKFKSSSRKFIFWMQEAKDDKDEENCRKVNEALNNPPTPSASRAGGGLPGLPADLAGLASDNDLQSILGSMSQQQLLQLLGGTITGGGGGLTSALLRGGGRPASSSQVSSTEEPSTPLSVRSSPGPQARMAPDGSEGMQPRPATVAAVSSHAASSGAAAGSTRAGTQPSSVAARAPGGLRLSDLRDVLSTVNVTDPALDQPAPTAALANALSTHPLIGILANQSVQQTLKAYMPPGVPLPPTEDSLRTVVLTPVFKEITNAFSAALISGQLSSVLGNFGLPEGALRASSRGDVDAFVRAMEEVISEPSHTDSDKMDEN